MIKKARPVAHQSSTCNDHMIIRNIKNNKLRVMQKWFSDRYTLLLSCPQKTVAKSDCVNYRKTAFLKNSKKIERLDLVSLDKLGQLDFDLLLIFIKRHFMHYLNETLIKLQGSWELKLAKPASFTKGHKKLSSKRNPAHKERISIEENESFCRFKKCANVCKVASSWIGLNVSGGSMVFVLVTLDKHIGFTIW